MYVALGLVASIISLALFGSLASYIHADQNVVVQFDRGLTGTLYTWATPQSTSFMVTVSLLGNEFLYVLGVGVGLLLLFRREWLFAAAWIITMLGGQVLMNLLKNYYLRPRPVFDHPLASEKSFAFPSGHAMMSLVAYGMLAYLICTQVKNTRARILIIFAAVLLATLIGISRLYLGVHYPSDVIGGYASGLIWLSVCITATEFVRRIRSHPRTKEERAATEIAAKA